MNMPKPRGPEPPRILLTEKQRAILREIVRRRTSPQGETVRAEIILKADEGKRNKHIAQALHITRRTVRIWRTRWTNAAEILRKIESEGDDKQLKSSIQSALTDNARSGCPPKFSADQLCRIVALACQSPADSGRPISHWTRRELADEAMKRGIVQSISPRSVGRFFFTGGHQAAPSQILAQQRKRQRS
jgi:putative transposase